MDIDRRAILAGLAGVLVAPAARAQAVAPRRSFAFDRNAASTGWRPFDFWDEQRIFLPARINGRPVDVMLDSGVTVLAVDSALAAELGLRRDAVFEAHGLRGEVEGGFSYGPATVDLGGLTLTTNHIAMLDMTPFSDLLERPLKVLLGRDLFDQVMVDMDFGGRQIAFHHPRRAALPPDFRAVPARQIGFGLRTVGLRLEDGAEIEASFDLGAGDAVTLSTACVAAHPPLADRRTAPWLSYGIEGWGEERLMTLREMEFGGFPLADVPASVSPEWTHDTPANIGIETIQRFRLVTDFSRDRIWLKPRDDAGPFWKDRTGLCTAPRGDHLEVLLVAPESPAAALGLGVGDRIAAIDGRPVADFPKGRPTRWGSRPAGTVVRLTLAGGAEHRLVLADYF